MQRVLITGANRGIGLEFARQGAARGDRVFATCRHPDAASELHRLANQASDRVTLVALDLADSASIDASYAQVQREVEGLDLLINNAAINPSRSERLGTLDADTMLRTLHVNSVGPVVVAQRYLDLLKAGNNPKVASITSGMGSIGQKQSGGSYSYSASKAALNMLMRLFAFDVLPLGIIAAVVNPGWVKTDMGGPGASLTPEQSVSSVLALVDGWTRDDAGRFFDWHDGEIPW